MLEIEKLRKDYNEEMKKSLRKQNLRSCCQRIKVYFHLTIFLLKKSKILIIRFRFVENLLLMV